jgi:RNA polymerase sigma-70 factor (ECF subfamily)
MKKDEKEIFSQLKAGDELAFEYFFKSYFQILYNYAAQIIKDGNNAEEIVEDTFVQIWDKRKSIELHGSPKSYLFRMIYNHCVNYLKHKKVRDKYEKFFIFHQPSPEFQQSISSFPLETLIDKEFQESLDKSIQKLPEQCRRVFTMSRLEDLSNKEISEKLGVSVNTVKTQLLRGLKRVRDDMKDFLILLFIRK